MQKRLFNYFSYTDFGETGRTHTPFEDVSDAVTKDALNMRGLLRRYERHLRENCDWLLKDAPRRADLRVREAVYHFTLYRFLCDFLDAWRGSVLPEFPTGNGRVDLLIQPRTVRNSALGRRNLRDRNADVHRHRLNCLDNGSLGAIWWQTSPHAAKGWAFDARSRRSCR